MSKISKDVSAAEAVALLSKDDGKVIIGSFVTLPIGTITGLAVLKPDNSLNVRYIETDKAKGCFIKSNGTHSNGKTYRNFSTSASVEQLNVLSVNPMKQFTSEITDYEVDGKKRTSAKMEAILN